ADLNVRPNPAPAHLRDLAVRPVGKDVAKTIHAHTDTRVEDAARTHAYARVERDVRVEHYVVADLAVLADDHVGADPRPGADPRAPADHRIRANGDPVAELRLDVHDRRRVDADLDGPLRVEVA